MGNRESINTRRVSFQRDPAGSITLSQEVGDRLRKGGASTATPGGGGLRAAFGSPHDHRHRRTPGHHHDHDGQSRSAIHDHTLHPATVFNLTHPESDSASARVLSGLEKRWHERIEELEERNERIESTLINELDGTVELVKEMLRPEAPPQKNICKKLEKEVIRCFDSNITRSISCHEEAKEFMNCVDKQRMDYLNRYLDS